MIRAATCEVCGGSMEVEPLIVLFNTTYTFWVACRGDCVGREFVMLIQATAGEE